MPGLPSARILSGSAPMSGAEPGRATAIRADDALLARFAGGDRLAARQLTERFAPRAFGVALRVLGDRAEAEDVAQEAMLRLWKIAEDWEPGQAQVSTWLYRVVMNLCIDIKRRNRGGMAALEDHNEPVDPARGAAQQLQDAARADALQAALMLLPERQRQAVVLRHIEGLSNPEIASVLDQSVEAVESLTARGKRALKSALAGQKDALGYSDER